jgi:hypothetical protein
MGIPSLGLTLKRMIAPSRARLRTRVPDLTSDIAHYIFNLMNATLIFDPGQHHAGNTLDSFNNSRRRRLGSLGAAITATCGLLLGACTREQQRPARPGAGVFTTSQDIGSAELPGQVVASSSNTYVVSGAGRNLWGAHDEFHFAFTVLVGDAQIGADIDLGPALGQRYRKALLMFRSSTESDAAYVDVAVHENGVGSLQYRPYAGAPTLDLQSSVPNPGHVRLIRRGSYFSAAFENAAGQRDELGPIAVALPDNALVGIGVNSADTDHLARVTFSNLEFSQAVSLSFAEGLSEDQ